MKTYLSLFSLFILSNILLACGSGGSGGGGSKEADTLTSQLMGNWRLDHIAHEDAGRIDPDADFDIFISFDASAHLLWLEYDLQGSPATCSPFKDVEPGYSAIYTGTAVLANADDSVATMTSNNRLLNTGCPAGSTDHVADMFGGQITIENELVVITHPVETNRKSYFKRFANQKNAIVGFWAEDTDGSSRNGNGTLDFGADINGLFSLFTDTREVHVVLDRNADGQSCEHNGIFVAEYTYDGTAKEVVYTNTLLNHVYKAPGDCGKTLPSGFDFGDFRDNGSTLPILADGIEDIVLWRNLSATEAAGDFKQ